MLTNWITAKDRTHRMGKSYGFELQLEFKNEGAMERILRMLRQRKAAYHTEVMTRNPYEYIKMSVTMNPYAAVFAIITFKSASQTYLNQWYKVVADFMGGRRYRFAINPVEIPALRRREQKEKL